MTPEASLGNRIEVQTQRYHLGLPVQEGAAEEARPSLLRLVRGEAPTDPQFEAFSHERSLENFEEACREAVRRLSLIDDEDGA